jgi:hypothetical protein
LPLPSLLFTNAFTGSLDSGSALGAGASKWIGAPIETPPQVLKILKPLAKVPDLKDWSDPDVGWGLVLPENSALTAAQQATAIDAPGPIQRLLAFRKGVVLRWSAALPISNLRRYYASGKVNDPFVALSAHGTGEGEIPRYLLIYAPPSLIPWRVQYRWNQSAFVGRLDLEGDGLKNYVDAVTSEWNGSKTVPEKSVTWAVDHGGADITHLMRAVVAAKLVKTIQQSVTGAQTTFLDGGAEPVLRDELVDVLAAERPALVVTSSHGMTGPLTDVPVMRSQLGTPVDAHQQVLDTAALLGKWEPDGAVWYSHACCSAGSDTESSFDGLIAAGSFAEQVVQGVAACGALTAPLPRALLGAPKPLRAFIGHVEPTFDWTLRDQKTGQVLTSALIEALGLRLYNQMPVGLAFQEVYGKAGQLEQLHQYAKLAFGAGGDTLGDALAYRLIAQDIENLVILGDPAEALF